MPRYSKDPYWISARYPGQCACGTPFAKGAQIMWFPSQRTAECETCGKVTQGMLDDDRSNRYTHAM